MLQQQVVHGPERALPVSGLDRLGAQRCIRVHVGQRQVSPDLSEVAEVGRQRPYDGLGRPHMGHSKSPYSTRVPFAIRRAAGVVAESPSIGSPVMRNQGLADQEASVGNRPVDTSRWATSPILVWVSRAARRSLSKAVIAST